MKKLFLFLAAITLLLTSCASASTMVSNVEGVDVSEYEYVVFGTDGQSDAELADVVMSLENIISEHLVAVSPHKARSLILQGKKVLTPQINVKSEKWDGGQTYMSITFYDYETSRSIAVIKSSGLGLVVSHDQMLAYRAIKKELNKVFR